VTIHDLGGSGDCDREDTGAGAGVDASGKR
jgi:hypothetical protein